MKRQESIVAIEPHPVGSGSWALRIVTSLSGPEDGKHHTFAWCFRVPKRKQEDRWATVPAGVGRQVAKCQEELSVELESGLYSTNCGAARGQHSFLECDNLMSARWTVRIWKHAFAEDRRMFQWECDGTCWVWWGSLWLPRERAKAVNN